METVSLSCSRSKAITRTPSDSNPIPQDHPEKITYLNIDYVLDDNDTVSQYCPLDNGRHHTNPRFSLGQLDLLPLELLTMVMTQLDLRSMTDFRAVNQRAMEAIDSIRQYAAIVTYSRSSLRGILSIGSGRWISCLDLYEKLTTAECESCRDFGGYIYLLTCRRVCFLCFTKKKEYLPMLRSDVARKFGVGRIITAMVPTMKSVPGYYSSMKIKCRTRLTLVDFNSAARAGVIVHGTVASMEQHCADILERQMGLYKSRNLKWKTANGQPIPRPPRTEDRFDGHSSNPRRFMAIASAPFLDTSNNVTEWGFHCKGCRGRYYCPPFHWRRKFTKKGFDEHIKQCGKIKDGEHV